MDQQQKNDEVCSIKDFSMMPGFASYPAIIKWSREHKLPKVAAKTIRSRQEVKLYSIEQLKQWHADVLATKSPKAVARVDKPLNTNW